MCKTPVELWVEALRSGEYRQGFGNLRRNDQYCCLGVLCEVYQRHVGGLATRVRDEDKCTVYDEEVAVLPRKVAEWVGLASRKSEYGPCNHQQLTVDNDNGNTFVDIADIIESRPPGLFVHQPEATSHA